MGCKILQELRGAFSGPNSANPSKWRGVPWHLPAGHLA